MVNSLKQAIEYHINDYGVEFVKECVIEVCESHLIETKKLISREMIEAKKIQDFLELLRSD
jgi:hypothetical protein